MSKSALVLSCIFSVGCGVTAGSDEVADPIVVTSVCDTPQRVGVRRLTRHEYSNTLRDLLHVDIEGEVDSLPADPLKGGFDNNADILTTTPEMFDRYFRLARRAVNEMDLLSVYQCTPKVNAWSDECYRQEVERFGLLAFRRPLDSDELASFEGLLSDLAEVGAPGGEIMRSLLLAIVTSPQVLYLTPETVETPPLDMQASEHDDTDPSKRPGPSLDGYSFASRLSFFLWRSTPDEELLAMAADGSIFEKSVLAAQVQRMLIDTRSEAFIEDFTLQWLDLTELERKGFDTEAYPEATGTLRIRFIEEVKALMRFIAHTGAPANELLSARYAFVHPELATHYGLPAPDAEGRTSLSDERRGFLTQGAVMAFTSHPDRTSIPSRGMWVMENLLCLPPPPPPPDSLDVDIEGFESDQSMKTQRERFAAHRASEACVGCHEVMDELGFGLEGFDPLGRYRTEERGVSLDTHGVLPDGTTFSGAAELADQIALNGDVFSNCISRNMLSFALGRLLNTSDHCQLEVAALPEDASLTDMIVQVLGTPSARTEAEEQNP